MELKLETFIAGKESSGGLLSIDGKFECFTCEDQHQDVKVANETRIHAGRYQILLRSEGGMNTKYGERFPFHFGMLWLQDVLNFEWIYLHVGYNDDHTSGCILVGKTITITNSETTLSKSELAYEKLYKKILTAINLGEEVWITVVR